MSLRKIAGAVPTMGHEALEHGSWTSSPVQSMAYDGGMDHHTARCVGGTGPLHHESCGTPTQWTEENSVMISLPYVSDFLLPQMCRYSLVFLIALNFFHGHLTFQPFIEICGLLSTVLILTQIHLRQSFIPK